MLKPKEEGMKVRKIGEQIGLSYEKTHDFSKNTIAVMKIFSIGTYKTQMNTVYFFAGKDRELSRYYAVIIMSRRFIVCRFEF